MTENPLTAGYESLGADINKMPGSDELETKQGIVSQKIPELTLDLDDEDISKITQKWFKEWEESDIKAEFDKAGKENEKYYKGKQFQGPVTDDERPMVDNLIFESLETYLPQVTRRNPDPMVKLAADASDPQAQQDNAQFIVDLKAEIAEIADKNKLRLKLKKAAKHESIFLLGVLKYSWDLIRDIPLIKVIRPQKMILDPKATIEEDGYTGKRVGEYRKMEASQLLKLLQEEGSSPAAIAKIQELVDKDKGTEVQFIEWWTVGTDSYMCWTLDKTVLRKIKNPHWNYTKQATPEVVDTYGNVSQGAQEEQNGNNHFENPRIPYSFLSTLNLGDRPVDDTSLIGQNLSNQDLINKRNKQITKNADNMNGGMVVSLARSGLTETQAKTVSKALQMGGTICIPDGAPLEAIARYPSPGLPGDIYNQLQDTRTRMRDIFGTRGSSTAGLESTDTVRGKILSRGLDTDRIGGGISEYLEQLADEAYNWIVQLLYVYDNDHQMENGMTKPRLDISVKEGSLLPKDSTTIANQAIDLCSKGKMSLLDMYKRLEYPNPEELAANVWLEANAPEVLYGNDPRIAQVIQQKQQAAQQAAGGEKKPPSMSMSFKDLPPEGQAQMAEQAGIQLTPQALAIHAAVNAPAPAPSPVAPSPTGPEAVGAVPLNNA